MNKIYFKHVIIRDGNQDTVEREINEYINGSENLNIISLNVIPEKIAIDRFEGYAIPKYWYHISIVYTCKD